MEKVDPASVCYREAAANGPRCGTCGMFILDHQRCHLVQGRILAQFVCDEYVPQKETRHHG